MNLCFLNLGKYIYIFKMFYLIGQFRITGDDRTKRLLKLSVSLSNYLIY